MGGVIGLVTSGFPTLIGDLIRRRRLFLLGDSDDLVDRSTGNSAELR